MPQLTHLRIERTKHFNVSGLQHLSDIRSDSRYNLRSFHLGVFKHKHFDKLGVAEFLSNMPNLTDFSLQEEDRSLIATESERGQKVMTYSALKLAIVQSVFGSRSEFGAQLKELKIIDKSLNPEYLLQYCPELTKLTIDWQEELSQVPFNSFPADWFSKVVQNPDWHQLCSNLTSLDLVFPAAYNKEAYNCPYMDFQSLARGSFAHLTSLKLRGMCHTFIQVQIYDILYNAPNLEELEIDECSIGFLHHEECCYKPHLMLKSLTITNKIDSIVVPEEFIQCITQILPNLNQLVVRPPNANFHGFLLSQIRCLTTLPFLQYLEIPVATSNCVNNMPEMVYVLREFPSLSFFVIIWSNYFEDNNNRLEVMTNWLVHVLKADNANIHVQMSFPLHSYAFGCS